MNESEIFNDAIRFQQLYVCLLDLDPCIDVTCHYHSLCKAFGPNDARCVCLDSCPTYKEPVCSSNGTTYDNKCLFEQEVCLNRLNFTVQHPGSCEGQQFCCLFLWPTCTFSLNPVNLVGLIVKFSFTSFPFTFPILGANSCCANKGFKFVTISL